MKKMVGYAISIAGIVVMAIGFGMINIESDFVSTLSTRIITIAGIVGVVIGVFVALKSEDGSKKKKKGKNTGSDEIPIYEGTGKNRRIVGYRKD